MTRTSIYLYYTLFLATLAIGQPSKAINDDIPFKDLQKFTTVIEQIKNNYVTPITDSFLFEHAIKGMLAGLDPHSAYLGKEDFAELRVNTAGKFGGIGIEVTLEEGFIKVISPLDDSPAAKADIKPGDFIIRINEQPIKGLDLTDAVEKMRGKIGSEIELTLLRKGENQPIKKTLLRETINIPSIKSTLLLDDYAYIRIAQFQADSDREFNAELNKFNKQLSGNLKGLILDLRNNPGGVLDSCVQIINNLLTPDKLSYDGLIVYTEGNIESAKHQEKANAKDKLNGAPIIVLVNNGSASAAEIVAGALQDHKRGIIMGSKTFGKGSVQTILPLGEDSGLKLTTALYYTPAGRSIQATGIIPDIEIPEVTITTINSTESLSFFESDLQGHLSKQKNQATPANKKNKKYSEWQESLAKDYHIQQALSLLKGLQTIECQQKCELSK